AELTLLSVVDAEAATLCCQRERCAYLDTRGSSDDGHGECNGFTASTVPATGLRAEAASLRPARVSYSSLIKPALRTVSPRPTGKLCRQSTCGAGLLRSCEPRRPSPALNLAAWRRPFPSV